MNWVLPEILNSNDIPESNITSAVRQVLYRRGYTRLEDIDLYINPKQLPNAINEFPDLEKALIRLKIACLKNEKIAICGDYDADGMTSTALLYNTLSKLGANPVASIPSRKDEGYGLNSKMLIELNKKDINLIITVDNGVSAIEAINLSKELGMEIILTDHHKIPKDLPQVHSLIHPEKLTKLSPYKYLAGVGLAYVIAKYLCIKMNKINAYENSIELFTIGTIADMAQLKGANRIWVKEGLESLHKSKDPAIKAIKHELKILNRKINCEDIGFKIAPLINAVGRIGDPILVLELFSESNYDRAINLVKECKRLNEKRKLITKNIEEEANNILQKNDQKYKNFTLLFEPHWENGVVGIVAARMVEMHNRPAAILGADKKGQIRGSVRAPKGFKVNESLNKCSQLLESYGGHSAAGGFTVKIENIDELHQRLNIISTECIDLYEDNKKIRPEAYLSFSQIDRKLFHHLSLLEPFGVSNTKPLFWTRGCSLKKLKILKGGYKKFLLNQGEITLDAVMWNNKEINVPKKCDIAFYVELNNWAGIEKLQLNVIAFKPYNDVETFTVNDRSYKCFVSNDGSINISNSENKIIKTKLDKLFSLYNNDESRYRYRVGLFKIATNCLGIEI